MSDSPKSRLETLSDELFLEIFSYMAATDLYSFKGLNKRIDSILGDVNISLDVQDEETAEEVLSIFSPLQVTRVKTKVEYVEIVQTMVNLRSLTVQSLLDFESEFDEVR